MEHNRNSQIKNIPPAHHTASPPKKNCVSCDCLDVSQRNGHKILSCSNFYSFDMELFCYFALLNPLKMCWNLDLKHGKAVTTFSNDDGWICVHHLLRGYDWHLVNFVMRWKWESSIGRSSQIQLQLSFLKLTKLWILFFSNSTNWKPHISFFTFLFYILPISP
jgi:hypothetical protein